MCWLHVLQKYTYVLTGSQRCIAFSDERTFYIIMSYYQDIEIVSEAWAFDDCNNTLSSFRLIIHSFIVFVVGSDIDGNLHCHYFVCWT